MAQNAVLESAEFIAKNAKYVSVNPQGLQETAAQLIKERQKGEFDLSRWLKDPMNPKVADEDTLQWIFLVDTLNFSFWVNKGEECPIEWNGKEHTGYYSLCAAINRARDEGKDILNAEVWAGMTLEGLRELFRTTTGRDIPLLEKRLEVLNEAGKVLKSQFQGHFKNVIAKAGRSAVALRDLVVSSFESYRDESTYKGRTVKIYKRAQILVADIWAAFEGMNFGYFDDIDEITMFADYRVPQSLVYFKCLDYSHELLDILNRNELIPNGDEKEVEIRGCSIWAVELVRREMEKQLMFDTSVSPLNAIVIDFYLWEYAKRHSASMDHIPIHRTRTHYY